MQVREKIALPMKEKYNAIGPSNFEFAKVTQKKISVLHLSKLIEYNCDSMKKLVGHGLLYIRMKVGFEFVLCENNTSDSDSELVKSGALKIINIPSTSNAARMTTESQEDHEKLIGKLIAYVLQTRRLLVKFSYSDSDLKAMNTRHAFQHNC